MKIAILSESAADEAAIRVLVDGILGIPSTHVVMPPPRSRGWSAIVTLLPNVINRLYYGTDAQLLVVTADSDETTPHESVSHRDTESRSNCRFCELNEKANGVLSRLAPVPGRAMLRVAIGVAVPAIEAWLACDQQPHLSEITWKRVLAGQSKRYSKQSLKTGLYGTIKPSLKDETCIMVERAKILAKNIGLLEARFPGGFGLLSQSLRQG